MSTRKYNAISSFEMKGSHRDHSGQSIDEYQPPLLGHFEIWWFLGELGATYKNAMQAQIQVYLSFQNTFIWLIDKENVILVH